MTVHSRASRSLAIAAPIPELVPVMIARDVESGIAQFAAERMLAPSAMPRSAGSRLLLTQLDVQCDRTAIRRQADGALLADVAVADDANRLLAQREVGDPRRRRSPADAVDHDACAGWVAGHHQNGARRRLGRILVRRGGDSGWRLAHRCLWTGVLLRRDDRTRRK